MSLTSLYNLQTSKHLLFFMSNKFNIPTFLIAEAIGVGDPASKTQNNEQKNKLSNLKHVTIHHSNIPSFQPPNFQT